MFDAALGAEPVDRKALAELTWSGVPDGLSRCEVWQLLLGYRPLAQQRAPDAIQRKREEYRELRRSFYDSSPAVSKRASTEECSAEASLLRQIRKDMPRTQLRCSAGCPASHLVEHPQVQALMERVLFIWAVRQPASGYVQGINDVLLPLVVVSLLDCFDRPLERVSVELLEELGEAQLADVEADCYWCTVKILSEIFDHYTQDFPGIQRMAQHLQEILRRIDMPLVSHLEEQGINIFQTAFQWIACLMVRELPISCCIRLWDTFIAESAQSGTQVRSGPSGDHRSAGFEVFVVYFCACFIAYFSPRLQAMDMEAISRFLQRLPTDDFRESDMEVLLSEAFVLKSLFQNAPQHLSGN